jgi:hypothetical protein
MGIRVRDRSHPTDSDVAPRPGGRPGRTGGTLGLRTVTVTAAGTVTVTPSRTGGDCQHTVTVTDNAGGPGNFEVSGRSKDSKSCSVRWPLAY